MIVGESTLNTSGHIGQTRPVMWSDSSQPQELWDDQFFGGKGLGINSSGFVVGRYGSGSGIPLPGPGIPGGGAFIWNPTTREFKDLGDLGGANVEATGINDAGQVVGSSEMPWIFEINGVPTILPVPRAFIWDEIHGMQDLGTLDGGASRGTAINSHEKVIGWSTLLSDGTDRAFIWDLHHGMQALPLQSSRAFAMNDQNQVVGILLGDGVTTPPNAFIWNEIDGLQLLPPNMGLPRGINNDGLVVDSRGNIWDPINGVQSLEELLSPTSEWQIESLFAINDAGHIVGYGRFEGELRGFLMVPVPEPNSL